MRVSPAALGIKLALLVLLGGSLLRAEEPVRVFQQPREVIQIIDQPPAFPLLRADIPSPSANTYFVPVLPPPPPLPTREPISREQLERLIAQLKSEDYQERIHATRELKNGGEETVEALKQAAATGSPEVYRRAVSVLTAIFLGSDSDANRAAEDALTTLRDQGAVSLAVHIDSVLKTNEFVRTSRAIEDIEALGGVVMYSPYMAISDPATGEQRREIERIRIPREWRGGDKGLKHLTRIQGLRRLMIIGVPGKSAAVSAEAIEQLTGQLPELEVEQRGAMIGIATNSTADVAEEGMLVDRVMERGPADRAGIRSGDIITHLNETKVESFNDLVALLLDFESGAEVQVKILRTSLGKQEPLTLDVTLVGWDDK